jgi:hypothetical protein
VIIYFIYFSSGLSSGIQGDASVTLCAGIACGTMFKTLPDYQLN